MSTTRRPRATVTEPPPDEEARPVTDDPDQPAPDTDDDRQPDEETNGQDLPDEQTVTFDDPDHRAAEIRPELPRRHRPRLLTAGLVTLEVVASDRHGLVDQLVDSLRSWRPDVTGWWVKLAAEGIEPQYVLSDGAGRATPAGPTGWRGRVTAVPVPPHMDSLYRSGLAPTVDDHEDPDGRDSFYLEVSCPNCPLDGHGQPTRTGWAVEGVPAVTGASPYAMRVDPVDPDQHVSQSDVRWLQGLIQRDLTGQHPLAREEALVAALLRGIEAVRLTREYVDPNGGNLPAVQGWDWFDFVTEAQALIRNLGFDNENEWHPDEPRQAHVPAPPVRPADPSPDMIEGFLDPGGRRGNTNADMTGELTRVEAPDPTRVDAPPTESWLPAVPAEVGPRTSGGTPVIVARPDPSMTRPSLAPAPRRPGRWARFKAAWRAAGQTAAPGPDRRPSD